MIPEPKCVKELQSFIGGINYYARFIPNMADIAKPLYKLLEKETSWEWTNAVQAAFKKLKACLSDSPVLGMYQLNLPLILACGASNYGVGAVISHINYSQIDKEGAAIIFGLKKFNQYLLGRHFTISTDNKALRTIFDPNCRF